MIINRTTLQKNGQQRIDFLDGLRGIAILLVIGFHYYSRYSTAPDIYPFGDHWAHFPLFEFGFYGVQIFFAVSGFVVALTLTRCSNLPEFAVRRLARLWPTMFLCSTIAYIFLFFFPYFFPKNPLDFIPSLTFIDGGVFEKIFPGYKFDWIDGAYWSLFVEVRFYALTGIVYFLNPTRFLRNFLIFFLSTFLVCGSLSLLYQGPISKIAHQILIPGYLPWFAFGIAAYCWWLGEIKWAKATAIAAFTPLIISSVRTGRWHDVVIAILLCILFALCFKFRIVRGALSSGWLTSIGVASYSLYLLHQNIGLTLTNILAKSLAVPPRIALTLPFLITVGMVLCARLIYKYWETPLNVWVVKYYRRPKVENTQVEGVSAEDLTNNVVPENL